MTSDSLDTGHLGTGLERRAARGGAVTLAGQGAKFVVQTGSTILLARLLVPADYGLVAMVLAITGIATPLVDFGLSMATIQRKDITQEQVTNLFWANLALGVAFCMFVSTLAPAFAWFYGEPRLTAITLVLSTTFLFTGLGVQHRALLQRQMRFNALVLTDLLALIGGLSVAIALAIAGKGYWALVANPVVAMALTAASSWFLCRWRPAMPTRGTGVRPLLSFGTHLAGFNLVNYAARSLDNVLIGYAWGAPQLGLYDRAYRLLMLPLEQLSAPAARVMVPTMSRCQSDPDTWSNTYSGGLTVMMLLAAPLNIFCLVFADKLIPLVLGEQWSGAVPIFRYLAVAGIAQSLCNSVGWVYISLGRTDRMFKWGVMASAIICLSFVIGLPFGPSGVALSYSAAMLSLTLPCLAYAYHDTGLTWSLLTRAISLPIVASTIAGLVSLAFRALQRAPGTGGLAEGVMIFLGIYGAIVASRPKGRIAIRGALRTLAPARGDS